METIFKLDLRFDTFRGMGVGVGTQPMRHFHISHHAPHLPPQFLHNLCFSFLFCIIAIPRELKNNAYAKFSGGGSGGWADEVHYGKCGSGSVEDEKFLKYLTFFRATLSILLPCLGHYLVLKPYIGIPKEQIHIIVIAFVYLE